MLFEKDPYHIRLLKWFAILFIPIWISSYPLAFGMTYLLNLFIPTWTLSKIGLVSIVYSAYIALMFNFMISDRLSWKHKNRR